MKVRDYCIFGSNATATLAAGKEEAVTWTANSLAYYEVAQNEALELVQLGVKPDVNVEKTYVRDRDNTDWFTAGFHTLGASCASFGGGNELPFDGGVDFTKMLVPISNTISTLRTPTLKLGTGDYLRVKVAMNSSNAAVAVSQAVAIVRKLVADRAGDDAYVKNYGKDFGGLASDAQVWHENAHATTQATTFTSILKQTVLKNELYAYNSMGLCYGTEVFADYASQLKIVIDEQKEYNTYPVQSGADCGDSYNFLPYIEEVNAAATLKRQPIRKPYVFDKPVVVTRRYNKTLDFQLKGGTAQATVVKLGGVYFRTRGVRYKLSD